MKITLNSFAICRINFGDENAKAIDMTWYKRAVDQHQIEPDSFVFSVPFDSGYSDTSIDFFVLNFCYLNFANLSFHFCSYTSKTNVTLVTAAHAIFIEHKGHKAPAAVVGLQFQHDSLARHFINITSAVSPFQMLLLLADARLYQLFILFSVHWVQCWCVSENMCFR